MSAAITATALRLASNVYLWAALCILAAVYFLFRSPGTT